MLLQFEFLELARLLLILVCASGLCLGWEPRDDRRTSNLNASMMLFFLDNLSRQAMMIAILTLTYHLYILFEFTSMRNAKIGNGHSSRGTEAPARTSRMLLCPDLGLNFRLNLFNLPVVAGSLYWELGIIERNLVLEWTSFLHVSQ